MLFLFFVDFLSHNDYAPTHANLEPRWLLFTHLLCWCLWSFIKAITKSMHFTRTFSTCQRISPSSTLRFHLPLAGAPNITQLECTLFSHPGLTYPLGTIVVPSSKLDAVDAIMQHIMYDDTLRRWLETYNITRWPYIQREDCRYIANGGLGNRPVYMVICYLFYSRL